jgi:ankyrin repeat protein
MYNTIKMSTLTIACNGDNLDSSYKIYNKTLLIFCKLRDIEKFKVLILGGHLIYYDTYDETTFLHEIVKNNMYDFFEVIESLILNKKIDINIVDINGNIPLHFALLTLNFRMVNLLLKYGSNITHLNHYGFSPVFNLINNY